MKNGKTFPSSYTVDYLSFTGIVQGNFFTSGINADLTYLISNGMGGNPYLQYLDIDPGTGEVTWEVGGRIDCTNPSTEGSSVTLNFPGRGLNSIDLFTIVVNGAPGDLVDFLVLPAAFSSCPMNCDEQVPVQKCVPDLSILFPPLPACSPNKSLAYSLGYTVDGLPLIKVTMNGLVAGQSITGLDGVIHIVPEMSGIPDITLESLPYNNGLGQNVDVYKNTDGSFDVYYKQNAGTVWAPLSTSVDLFGLIILGQFNLSQGGTFKCNSSMGRMTINNQSVCALVNSQGNVVLPGYGPCNANLSVSATRLIDTDCQLGVTFTLNHSASGALPLRRLRLKCLFKIAKLNNPLSLIDPDLPGGTLTLNSQTNLWEYNYTYENETTALNLVNGTTVTVPFRISRSCVEYFVAFAEAEPFEGGGLCAMATNIDLLHWPACNPEIYGQASLPSGGRAPAYTATLFSTSDPAYALDLDKNCTDAVEEFVFCPDQTKAPFRIKVESSEPDNYLCGVSTLDKALIVKHLLGIQLLPFPFGQIAANVTKDNDITGEDVDEIHKILIGLSQAFDVPSWQYIRESIQFSNGSNPHETISKNEPTNIANIPSSGLGGYGAFTAVKRGDVNQSCRCSQVQYNSSESIGSQAWFRSSNTESAIKGARVEIPIALEAPFDLLALQGGFRFDASIFEFVEVLPNESLSIEVSDFGTKSASAGAFRFSWATKDGKTLLPPNAALFTLVLQLKTGASLPKGPLVYSSNHLLRGLAYAKDETELPISLKWQNDESLLDFSWAIVPNPVSDFARIWMYANQNIDGMLRLYNTAGDRVGEQVIAVQSGEQSIQFSLENLPSGVYFASIEIGGRNLQRRLVKL